MKTTTTTKNNNTLQHKMEKGELHTFFFLPTHPGLNFRSLQLWLGCSTVSDYHIVTFEDVHCTNRHTKAIPFPRSLLFRKYSDNAMYVPYSSGLYFPKAQKDSTSFYDVYVNDGICYGCEIIRTVATFS